MSSGEEMQIIAGLPSALVLVRLSMRPASESGRRNAFSKGYRPHFVVAGHAEWLGVYAVQVASPIAPRTVTNLVFALVYHPEINYTVLIPGCKFAVHEGSRVVG